jgi:hypothetical protein
MGQAHGYGCCSYECDPSEFHKIVTSIAGIKERRHDNYGSRLDPSVSSISEFEWDFFHATKHHDIRFIVRGFGGCNKNPFSTTLLPLLQ